MAERPASETTPPDADAPDDEAVIGEPEGAPGAEDVLEDADDELDDGLAEDVVLPPDAAPSVEPGPRTIVVPEGEIIRRVDRFVADRTGLSRSYVQKLTSEGLLVDQDGRRLRANSVLRGGSVTLEVPPAEIPYHLEPDPTIPVDAV